MQAEQAALALYQESFGEKKKKRLMRPKAFVKGGTYDITKKKVDSTGSGSLYLPTNQRMTRVLENQKK